MACIKPELRDNLGTCRVCMRKCNSLKEIFVPECKIVERIQFCTGILLTNNPTLPSLICLECNSQLNIAHKFKTTCIESDNAFRQLNIKVKNEDIIKEEIDTYEDVPENTDCEGLDCKSDNTLNIVKDQEISRGVKKDVENKQTVQLQVVCTKKGDDKRNKISFRKQHCKACKIRFDTIEESIQHHEKLHNTSKFICEVCGKQFLYKSSHIAHLRIHGKPSYACAHCPYNTVNKPDLKKHLTLHTGEKKFQCHACPLTFRTNSNLHIHIRHKHGGEKKFFCDKCELSFHQRHRLKRHLDTHSNMKRHECPLCPARYSRRCLWKKHLLKVHAVSTPPARPGRRAAWFEPGNT